MKRYIRATLDSYLMSYIPKEYKPLVSDIYKGRKEFDEMTNREYTPICVEWVNGQYSSFKSAPFMRFILKDQHSPSEYGG